MVKGNLRLGTFSQFSINLGEELTLEHQWYISKSRNPTKCHCILCDCRGFLEEESYMLAKSIDTNSEIVMQEINLESNNNKIYVNQTRIKCD